MDPYILYNQNISLSSANKKLPGHGSIDQLIENTLSRLQSEQSSTIYTILQSGDRIRNRYEFFEKESRLCPICYAERDKMLNVLEVGGVQDFAKDQEIDLTLNKTYLESEWFQSKSDLEKFACFACQRTLQNSKKELVDILPEQFKKNMEPLKNQCKDIVAQFFLEKL